MTDRIAGFLVTLDKDMREDDAEAVLSSIGMTKGVLSVKPVEGGSAQHVAEERVRRELGDKLMAILFPKT